MHTIIIDNEISDICAEALTNFDALERVEQVVDAACLTPNEVKDIKVNLREQSVYAGDNVGWLTILHIKVKRFLDRTKVSLERVENSDVHMESRFGAEPEYGEAA